MLMTTSTRQVGNVTIVGVAGRIVVGEESAALRLAICDQLVEGRRRILLNLVDVDYIDSTGLGQLASAVVSARKLQGDLKLLHLSTNLLKVLEVTKLNTVIEIMDDEAVAIESFSRTLTAAK